MIVTFKCDPCGREEKADIDSIKLARLPYGWGEITPGQVGTKMMCGGCWERWRDTVTRFFNQRETR